MVMYYENHVEYLQLTIPDLLTNFWLLSAEKLKSWYCMPPTSVDADSDDSKKRKATPRSLLQRKVPRLDVGQ